MSDLFITIHNIWATVFGSTSLKVYGPDDALLWEFAYVDWACRIGYSLLIVWLVTLSLRMLVMLIKEER